MKGESHFSISSSSFLPSFFPLPKWLSFKVTPLGWPSPLGFLAMAAATTWLGDAGQEVENGRFHRKSPGADHWGNVGRSWENDGKI